MYVALCVDKPLKLNDLHRTFYLKALKETFPVVFELECVHVQSVNLGAHLMNASFKMRCALQFVRMYIRRFNPCGAAGSRLHQQRQ